MKDFKQKGQVLVEALIALGAAVIIIGVIVVVVVNSLNNSEFAKNQNLATQYAQQGIQIIRETSETSWTDFAKQTGQWYCLYENSATLTTDDTMPTSLPNSCKWDNAIFNRRIYIEQDSAECSGGENAKISVIVAWNDSKCTNPDNQYCHKAQLDSCFTNLKTVPTI